MTDLKYLELLAKEHPSKKAAISEYINLKAILALPKGTEYFLSDLHGEHEAFIHMLKSGSGTIMTKINESYDRVLSEEDREALAALIYNPKAEIERRKKTEEDFDKWCTTTIYRLIVICKAVSTKYTRSKVRRRLPKHLDYIMDELLHADDEQNKSYYYSEIISTIVEEGMGAEFIEKMADSISSLAVDQLHIIGDIFDRGAHPDTIMDYLLDYHDVDFQWGNHDIVWMGAAAGNWACITNILRMNISYNNFDMLEVGYGFNLRRLTTFAETVYKDDPCTKFKPHIIENNQYDFVDEELAAKMHKAIAVIQFKVEGQTIIEHPEYGLDHRLIMDKIDWEEKTVKIDGVTYELMDTNFPTVDKDNPYVLTPEELEVMHSLSTSITKSEKLQKHIKFLFDKGALYKKINGNLLYHGCVPMEENGDFKEVEINGKRLSGEPLFNHLDEQVRKSYFSPKESLEFGRPGDIMWYLWLAKDSPLFGKEKMTTFERLFIADKKAHKEPTRPYYKLIKQKEPCEKILREFGLDPLRSKILNGHVPVKIKDGESPIKGGGLLYVIDGGISKAYQKQTGIAGYTFIFNSWTMALAEHSPYQPIRADGTQEFMTPTVKIVEKLPRRMLILDTDKGLELEEQARRVRDLAAAYDKGLIRENSI